MKVYSFLLLVVATSFSAGHSVDLPLRTPAAFTISPPSLGIGYEKLVLSVVDGLVSRSVLSAPQKKSSTITGQLIPKAQASQPVTGHHQRAGSNAARPQQTAPAKLAATKTLAVQRYQPKAGKPCKRSVGGIYRRGIYRRANWETVMGHVCFIGSSALVATGATKLTPEKGEPPRDSLFGLTTNQKIGYGCLMGSVAASICGRFLDSRGRSKTAAEERKKAEAAERARHQASQTTIAQLNTRLGTIEAGHGPDADRTMQAHAHSAMNHRLDKIEASHGPGTGEQEGPQQEAHLALHQRLESLEADRRRRMGLPPL